MTSFSLYCSPTAYAEYRVYQYYTKSKLDLIQDKNAYLVTSTLDPQTYISYHGGANSLTLDLLRTWICPGFTGLGRPICKSPYEKVLDKKIKK